MNGELVGGARDGTRLVLSPGPAPQYVLIPRCMNLWTSGAEPVFVDTDIPEAFDDVPHETWMLAGRRDQVALYVQREA